MNGADYLKECRKLTLPVQGHRRKIMKACQPLSLNGISVSEKKGATRAEVWGINLSVCEKKMF